MAGIWQDNIIISTHDVDSNRTTALGRHLEPRYQSLVPCVTQQRFTRGRHVLTAIRRDAGGLGAPVVGEPVGTEVVPP